MPTEIPRRTRVSRIRGYLFVYGFANHSILVLLSLFIVCLRLRIPAKRLLIRSVRLSLYA
jgi:hypothetical protein